MSFRLLLLAPDTDILGKSGNSLETIDKRCNQYLLKSS